MHRSSTARLIAVAVAIVMMSGAGAAAAAPGIDVSRYQGEIDWSQVAGDGYSFAFIRSTGGTLTIDERYDANRMGAALSGIRMGAYHFANPNGDTLKKIRKDARAEADFFLSIAEPAPGDLFPVLDVEGDLNDVRTRWLKIWLRIWLERVEAAVEEKPIIYTNPSTWKNRLNDTTEFAEAGHPLWIAHYTSAQSPDVPAANWAGNGWAFWQFTDQGSVSGIEGNVDLDEFSGSSLDAYTIPVLPVNTAPPTVSGEAQTGSTLVATTGTWKGTRPLFYTYKWLRCDGSGAGCEPISGANSAGYQAGGADFGHTLRIRIKARNAAGETFALSEQTGTILDGQAPVTRIDEPVGGFTGTNIPVAWSGTDDASGIAWYDVQYRAAPAGEGFGPWIPWLNDTTETTAGFEGEPGATYCFQAAAMDNSGNVSSWSDAGCAAVRLDDAQLSSDSFSRRNSASTYMGTFSQARKKGSRLRIKGIDARRIDILVTKCKGCGSIDVFLGDRRLARLDLRARSTRFMRAIPVATFRVRQTGTLKIVVTSSGRPVKIDGLGISRL